MKTRRKLEGLLLANQQGVVAPSDFAKAIAVRLANQSRFAMSPVRSPLSSSTDEAGALRRQVRRRMKYKCPFPHERGAVYVHVSKYGKSYCYKKITSIRKMGRKGSSYERNGVRIDESSSSG